MSSIQIGSSRFRRPVFLWTMVALIAELVVQWLSARGAIPFSLRFLTLLPLLPATMFLAALERTVRKMDELQRRISLESAFIAFLLTLFLAFILTGLERVGIHRGTADGLATAMLFFWACSYSFFSWRYR
jgi:hypothetical protein